MEDRNPYPFAGLTEKEVYASLKKSGSNKIDPGSDGSFWHIFKETISDPMLILLAAAAVIYFVSGQISDALFMSGAILFVTAISVYQNYRSHYALRMLREFTQSSITVIRDNRLVSRQVDDIVVGDHVVVSEGALIPADGTIKQLNDFSVNESILTGESYSVAKGAGPKEDNKVYRGTLVASGQCVFEVNAVGNHTKLGILGKSIQHIRKQRSPLKKQVDTFVKWMSLVGSAIFILIWIVTYLRNKNILDSLLKSLTIAMSVLPEEIPVAFVSFMALGAWRLMKTGVIVKDPSLVEALGAASIICLDKTGTITENRMEIYRMYDFVKDIVLSKDDLNYSSAQDLISAAMWASETTPFDPMEKAIHEVYDQYVSHDCRPQFTKVHEYPLDGKPPMMTHIFENSQGVRIIAMKGAPEGILEASALHEDEKIKINDTLLSFTKEGLRVLGVGTADFSGTKFPEKQQEFKVRFIGLIAFRDPPKENIRQVFQQLYGAGIHLKIITGDNPMTTVAIAKQCSFQGYEKYVTGTQLVNMDKTAFDKAVVEHNLFTRVFPELKLEIIQSLKRQKHIVAMTGDGVNDGPALRAADIGIAMGKRGSEIAKEASAIILTDDDFGKMINAITMGRRIYSNLKKAIQYIISIHIPIILTVTLPLLMHWKYPVIFTPVHVIFLELIMGPTCSIVYENEPAEKDSMLQKPRIITQTFFNLKELMGSMAQGLAITAGTLAIYQWCVGVHSSEQLTRSMVFTTLIFANILLTLVNRSFHYSVFTTFRYKNNLLWAIVGTTLTLLILIQYIPFLSSLFQLSPLNLIQISCTLLAAILSVGWLELWKQKRKAFYRDTKDNHAGI